MIPLLSSLFLPKSSTVCLVGGVAVRPEDVAAIGFDLAPIMDPANASPAGPFCFIYLSCGEKVIARCTVEEANAAIFGSDAVRRAMTLDRLSVVVEVLSTLSQAVEGAIEAMTADQGFTGEGADAEAALVDAINRLPAELRASFLDDVLQNVMNRQVMIGEIPGEIEPLGPFTSYYGAAVEHVADLFFAGISAVERVRLITYANQILHALNPSNPATNAPTDTSSDGPGDGPAVDSDDGGGAPVVA